MFAGGDAEAELVEDGIVAAVGKTHRLEYHLPWAAPLQAAAPGGGTAAGIRQFDDVQRLVQQFADALDGGQPSLDLGEAFGQLPEGIKQPLGEQDEGGQASQSHAAAGHHPAPHGQDHRHRHQGDPFDEGGNGTVIKDGSGDGPAIGVIAAGKATAVFLLAPKHLHHLQPLQVLLQFGVEAAQFFAHAVIHLAVAPLQPDDGEGHGNLAGHQQQAQPPLD